MTTLCPTAADLREWLAAGELTAAVAEHVSHCTSCQSALDALSDDPELRQWADRLASTDGGAFDATVPAVTVEPAMPVRVGPYRLHRELGRGGMGVVYLATDEVLNRDVALKLMARTTSEARERFLREVRAAARIQHANVVGVYGAGVVDDVPYLAMEYVDGLTLAEMIRRAKRVPARQAVELIVQVADGLSAAHAAGLVHRDVKPSNILIDDTVAKLADFGMVRDDAGSDLTLTGTVAGTPAYLSPEQARQSDADSRSDVYSLGVTLYESLTGEVPHRGTPYQVVKQILDDDPRPPRMLDETIPRDVETIVLKALAKEPSRRYQSAKEFADDLRRWLAGEPIRARPASRRERAWRWCRRNPRVAALTGSVAALLVALAVGGVTAAVLVNRSRNAALAAQEKSEADFELALQSLTALVDTVQTQMGSQPGLLPVKRQLLETAAEKLQAAMQSATPSEKLARLRLKARERLGAVYLELGRTAEAKAEFEASVQEASILPADLEIGRRAAAAHDQLGTIAYYAKEDPTALVHYKQAQEIRRGLAATNPDVTQLRRDEAVSHNKIGDVQRITGDAADAKASYTAALRLQETLPAEFPNPGQWLFDMSFVHGRLFDASLLLGEWESAAEHANTALTFAEQRMKLEPGPGRADVAYGVARLAQLSLRRGDVAGAVPHRRRVLELQQQIVATEPASAKARRDLYLDQGFLADALGLAGHAAAAREAAELSRNGCAKEAAADPGSPQKKIDLAIAHERLMALEFHAGRYADAASWAGKNADPRSQRLQRIFDAAAKLKADPEFRDELQILAVASLARDGKHSEAAALAQSVKLDGVDARILFELACCWHRCHKPDQALAVLEAIVKQAPGGVTIIAPHHEFKSLHADPRFRKLVGWQ